MPDLNPFLDNAQKELGKAVAVALWGLISGGFALLGRYLWELIRNWREARKKAKQSHPVYLAQKQKSLDRAADRACLWSGADHAAIYQFHNGQYFANHDSIQKMSMTGEGVESELIRRWQIESQNMPTVVFSDFIESIGTQAHVWLYRDECQDYEMNRLMRQRGYACSLAVLLKGAKNAWLGVLVMSWGEGHFTDEHISLPGLVEHQREASFILSEQ
ncbi:hypothetical protein DNI29_04520 [Hymenobacter sediminis]|uniref:hypothetical protein n=1 Tax=Hymenobacter sediminis TaxID=2218621 RepID=UPI000DA6477F|nr:hypothetical protein [Hymenobacter sediminis]RPD50067.1 hypothetical protein DNI29_04520 [Hymenobacter sediminis]